MRELTLEERITLDRRRSNFDEFLAERMPVLAEFADALGVNDPVSIVADPDRYLPPIDVFMQRQVVEKEDRVWIITRLGYFIGEVLIQRLSGCWFLNETPDTRYFLHYVVGQFSGIRNHNAMVSPFEVATALIEEAPRRSLADLVASVERELRAA